MGLWLKVFISFLFLFPFFALDFLQRVENHFVLEDYRGALEEAKALYEKNPLTAREAYLKALSKSGQIEEVLELLKEEDSPSIQEEIAWGILEKEALSSHPFTRFCATIGAYFTRDARAVPLLLMRMEDSDAKMRTLGIRLSCSYQDDILKNRVMTLLEKDRSPFVRLEALSAIGEMHLKQKAGVLKAYLEKECSEKEKETAISSLTDLYDTIEEGELGQLSLSSYPSLRILSCKLAIHFSKPFEGIKKLLTDPIASVRVAAFEAGVYLPNLLQKEDLLKGIADANPLVAITASWAGLLSDLEESKILLKKYLDDPEWGRVVAGVIGKSGQKGLSLGKIALKSKDPFTRLNATIALIEEREETQRCCDILFSLLQKRGKWMREKRGPFSIIVPSLISPLEAFPGYPDAIDSSLRLELFSLLASLNYPKAEQGIAAFLKHKHWEISGYAAELLLQEGDEECLELVKKILDEEDPLLRLSAALALAYIAKDPASCEILVEAYEGSSEHMKRIILEALSPIAPPSMRPFFLRCMKDSSVIGRIMAASALIQSFNR